MAEDRWRLDEGPDHAWLKATLERGARRRAPRGAGPETEAVLLARLQRRYAFASSLGSTLDVLVADVRSRFPFERVVSAATHAAGGAARGAGVPRAEVDAFLEEYLRGGAHQEAAGEHALIRALSSWRAGVVIPATTFGASFAAVVAVDVEAGHPALEDVRAALDVAAPFLARAAELDEMRVRLEERGAASRRRRGALDAVPDPVLVLDAEGRVGLANRRAAELFLADPDDPESHHRVVRTNNLYLSAHRARVLLRDAAGTSPAGELELRDPATRETLLFEVLAGGLGDAGAGPGETVFVLRDVTTLGTTVQELERELERSAAAERAARQESEHLHAILGDVGVPIFVTDPSSRIVLMNRETERLLGLDGSGEEGAGPATPNRVRLGAFVSESLLHAERRHEADILLEHPRDRRLLLARAASTKILDEEGEPRALVTVLHDRTQEMENRRLATDLKRLNAELEERVAHATADLAARNEELVLQRAELLRVSRLKSDFLATMSHELRTPINAILGYNSLMSEGMFGELTERQEDGLRRMRAAAEHLLLIVNDILDLSRVEAGKLQLVPVELELERFLERVCESMRLMVDQKGLECILDVAPDTPVVRTDRTRLWQVVLNLLSNAVKFTDEGCVRVRAGPLPDGARVWIEVEDTGVGIPEEYLDVIFEEFRQVGRERTGQRGGSGLGLSISRKLAGLLGGTLSVRSTVGVGTTFRLELPVRFGGEEAPD